jgi:acyl dehydratase
VTTSNVGDSLPPLERTITQRDMVAYAGATWDWHRLHYDQAFVETAGLDGPIVDGQVFGALFVELLQDTLGPRAFVHQLEFAYRNLMFAGETVRCTATVSAATESRLEIELLATILASDAGEERIASGPARAVVLLDSIDASSVADR